MSIPISAPSYQSLFVETFFNETKSGFGTAFVARLNGGKDYLLTNRHIVTGRHNETDECLDKTHGCIPNRLVVWHNARSDLGPFVSINATVRRRLDSLD